MQRSDAHAFISYIVSYALKRWRYIGRRGKFFARMTYIKKCVRAAARFAASVKKFARIEQQLPSYFPITIAAVARKARRAQQVLRTSPARSRRDCKPAQAAGRVQGKPLPALPGGAANYSNNSQHY